MSLCPHTELPKKQRNEKPKRPRLCQRTCRSMELFPLRVSITAVWGPRSFQSDLKKSALRPGRLKNTSSVQGEVISCLSGSSGWHRKLKSSGSVRNQNSSTCPLVSPASCFDLEYRRKCSCVFFGGFFVFVVVVVVFFPKSKITKTASHALFCCCFVCLFVCSVEQ